MDFIDDFIQEYKNSPCLWKADCVDFKNRSKRHEAYMQLIDVAAKHGEHYNVERTKQKINNLRCAFRHQLKKYTEFQTKGLNDEPYCPKRRYFESLMFLKDEERNDKKSKLHTTSNIENTEIKASTYVNYDKKASRTDESIRTQIYEGVDAIDSIDSANKIYDKLKLDSAVTSNFIEYDEKSQTMQKQNEEEELNHSMEKNNIEMQIIYDYDKEIPIDNNKKNNSRKRSTSLSSQQSNTDTETINVKNFKTELPTIDFEKLFTLACRNFQDTKADDHFSNFGKLVAHKLRTMESSQAIYAEKLIGDVLYQGQMKLLTSLNIERFLRSDSPYNL